MRLLTLLAPLVAMLAAPLIAVAQYQFQTGGGASAEVAGLCQTALRTYGVVERTTITETTTLQQQPQMIAYAVPAPTITYAAPLPPLCPTPAYASPLYAAPYPAFGGYGYGVRSFGGHGYGFDRLAGGGYDVGNRIEINNFNGRGFGGHTGFGFGGAGGDVVINNSNFQQRGGGGGGLSNGIANIIGAIGDVANSPAGLFTIGALAGGGFGRGGKGGGGAQSFLNFTAAQNAGLSPQAAAAFAASQQGAVRRGAGPAPTGVRPGIGPRLPAARPGGPNIFAAARAGAGAGVRAGVGPRLLAVRPAGGRGR